MRNRALGALGVLFGGAVLLLKLLSGRWVDATGAYAVGQAASIVFAVLLVAVGLYYLLKGGGRDLAP